MDLKEIASDKAVSRNKMYVHSCTSIKIEYTPQNLNFPLFLFVEVTISSVLVRLVSCDAVVISHISLAALVEHIPIRRHKGRAQLRPFEPIKKVIF